MEKEQSLDQATADKKIAEDNCPDWAHGLIEQLRQLEVHLGNIPSALEWRSDKVEKIQLTAFDGGVIKEEHTEMVFCKVARGLSDAGYSPEQIVGFVNNRIGYEGGPAYCDIDEVVAATR